jgi:hypothetical protein
MCPGTETRKAKAKKAALDELGRLSEGRHSRNQTLLARFARCQELQQAAHSFAQALDAELRVNGATPLAPPPGWLPPIA